MVILSKIYTRTGDEGFTSLGDGTRVSKLDSRVGAMSAVDETNSLIGVLVANKSIDEDIRLALSVVQNDLFDVGADISTPLIDGEKRLRITQEQVDYLEKKIDYFNDSLDKLKSFVIPSGTPAAAEAHVARTVSRRAERQIWLAIEENGNTINMLTAKYMNRLSDLLFVIARYLNQGNDVLWKPGKNR